MDELAGTFVLRIKRSCEWTYVIVGFLGFVLFSWGIIDFRDLSLESLEGARFGQLAIALFYIIGPNGFRIIAVVVAALSGATCGGAYWRLRDSRPSLTANSDGLTFHPSIFPRPLRWSEVQNVEITADRPTQLRIYLPHRALSLYLPTSGTSVRIPIMVTGWTYREARQRVGQMNRWRRANRR